VAADLPAQRLRQRHADKKGLQGYMDITHALDDPRFTRVSPYTKRLFVHHYLITNENQLDARFAGWTGEAYAVGQGEHLTP
jgi:hypothetical protein